MRRIVPLVAVLTTVLLAASCERSEPEPLLPPISASEISAEALWSRITSESDYRNYSFWPGHEGENPGQSPHGPVHRIYVNRTLLNAIPMGNRIAPAGSIIVKDNLTSARELDGITVMMKVEGYDPENGDWFWAAYSPDGTARAAGKLGGCITCHEGASDNDYVIVQRLDSALPQ